VSLNVAMLEAMQAEGLTLEQCIRILKAGAPDSAAEKRRAYDRQRKAEKRAEAKSGGKSAGSPPDPSPNEIDILTPTRESKTEAKASSKSVVSDERKEAMASCLRRAFPAPDGVSEAQWAAFRKQRKKAINDRSYALLTAKLVKLAEAGWPPGEMIDLAIERGWETVFEPRTFGHERADTNPTATALRRVQDALRSGGPFG
jgi:hypothetical protein